MTPVGFPHSDIHGSTPPCGSPWLIAAQHVLLRLLAPRHPPSALTSLTTTMRCRTSPNSALSIALGQVGPCGVKTKVRSLRILDCPVLSRRESLDSANLSLVLPTTQKDPRFVLLFDCQFRLVEDKGIEPSTSGLQSPRSPS